MIVFLLSTSPLIALIAVVYSVVLTEPGEIFSGWYKLLEKILMPKFEWLFKPLIGCDKCVAGQLALWLYCPIRIHFGYEYYWFTHLALIALSIFLSLIFKTIYLWLRQKITNL